MLIFSRRYHKAASNNTLINSLAHNNHFQCNPVSNIGKRVLDLVLSNRPESVQQQEAEQPLVGVHLYHTTFTYRFENVFVQKYEI